MQKMMIVFTLLIFTLTPLSVKAEETSPPIEAIESYFNALNNNQWREIPTWWVKNRRDDLNVFFNDKENKYFKRGLLNIKEVKLVGWKELPYEYGKQFISTRYLKKFKNPRVFYVAVNYKVRNQNKYFMDGVNYFLTLMVLENEEWKIALTPHVPVNSIISDGYGFGTDDEISYDERRLKHLTSSKK